MILRASGCLGRGNNDLLTVLSISSQFNILDIDGPSARTVPGAVGYIKRTSLVLVPLC